MKTINERKYELIININEMKNGSIEEMFLIIKYSLNAYFKSLQTFGKDNRVTKDNFNIIREMFKILKRERKLLNYILDNIDKFNIEAAEDAVGMLDEVNDKTIKYYYDLINDIEDAAETGQEFRGYRPRREEKTLITDESYTREVFALGMNFNDLKDFLGYEDEFWDFIKTRIKVVDTSYDIMSKMVRVTPIFDNDDVVDIDLLVPKIYDIKSLFLALDTFDKAHYIYYTIKKDKVCNDKNSTPNIQTSLDEYISKKANEYLKIKNVN